MYLEHDVLARVRQRDPSATSASIVPWLTQRGHLNPFVRQHAPATVIDTLDAIHSSLGGDRRALAHATDTPLRTGLVVGPDHRRVQIDDVGHFTSDRLTALGWYPTGSLLGFQLDAYTSLIETWRRRAAAVFTRRWSADFDFAGGRRARRAYEDALLDLLTPIFTGMPLLRIAAPDGDADRAAAGLGLALVRAT